jgi:hypothetical protein
MSAMDNLRRRAVDDLLLRLQDMNWRQIADSRDLAVYVTYEYIDKLSAKELVEIINDDPILIWHALATWDGDAYPYLGSTLLDNIQGSLEDTLQGARSAWADRERAKEKGQVDE